MTETRNGARAERRPAKLVTLLLDEEWRQVLQDVILDRVEHDEVARVVEERSRKWVWTLHFKDTPHAAIVAALGGIHYLIVNDGDCGNCWGEPRRRSCPTHPVVTVADSDLSDARGALRAAGIGYCITDASDWSQEQTTVGDYPADSGCVHVP